MPLASSGLSSSMSRQLFRAAHNPPNISSARGLHTPSFVPRGVPPQPSTPFSSRIFQRTRTILNAFVGHLTTPGTVRASAGGSTVRSMQSAASRMPKIESNWSLPVRHALSVRMGAPRLPRPPAVPRNIAQVGLGTARNFTTGRPIFQNLADKMHNIPVASRAFLEADLDMRSKDDSRDALASKLRRARNGKSKRRSRPVCPADTKLHFHPAASRPTASAPETEGQAQAQAEFDKYFAPPQIPDVSTTLLIPLAPTPTSRVPLAYTFAYDQHPLIPFLEISALHVDSERHAARVRALFEQLDAARAWDKGATCETLGGARGAGVLRVRFAGWSAHAVRGILGEAATGWCVLEEEHAEEEGCAQAGCGEEEDMSDFGSAVALDLDPDGLGGIAELNLSSPVDPAYSFVLPTLDFSAASSIEQLPSGVASNVSQSDLDVFSDLGYAASDGDSSGGSDLRSWIEPPDALHSRIPSWAGLSFSSTFSQRLEEGPREEMF